MIAPETQAECSSTTTRGPLGRRGMALRMLLAGCVLFLATACGFEKLPPESVAGGAGASGSSDAPVIDPGAPSRQVTLRWMPSASSGVVRYDLSVGRSPGVYETTLQIPVSAANRGSDGVWSYPVMLQSDVDHYLALRAYNGQRISTFSNEIRVAATGGSGGGSGAGAAASTATVGVVTSGGGSGAGAPYSSSSSTASAPATTASSGDAASDGSSTASVDADATVLTSVELDGAGQYLGSATPGDLGAGEPLTLSTWLRPRLDYAPRRVLLELRPVDDPSVDRVTLALVRGEDLELTVTGADGSALYRALFEAAPAADLWQHLSLVFDPSGATAPSVLLDMAPCTLLSSDSTGWAGIAESDWTIHLGGSADAGTPGFAGRIGHTAIWLGLVPRTEMASVYERGHQIDLRLPIGAYESMDALVHYWRLGEDVDPLGYDLGRSDGPIDFDDPAGGLDSGHIVLDGPASLLGTAIAP